MSVERLQTLSKNEAQRLRRDLKFDQSTGSAGLRGWQQLTIGGQFSSEKPELNHFL